MEISIEKLEKALAHLEANVKTEILMHGVTAPLHELFENAKKCLLSDEELFCVKIKIKNIAENYHDRVVFSQTYAPDQLCECCGSKVIVRTCIEHDSQDISKDMHVCPDCYIAIATYWGKYLPKKICPV